LPLWCLSDAAELPLLVRAVTTGHWVIRAASRLADGLRARRRLSIPVAPPAVSSAAAPTSRMKPVLPRDPTGTADTRALSTDGGATFIARATNLPAGRLTAVPGIAGDLWIADGGKGLVHSTDGGRTFTTLTTVQSASALGFGKAAPGAAYQALYLIGTVKDVTGVFRSTDKGATWLRVNDDTNQWGSVGGVAVITGDPDTYGRVYVGTNGRGLQYGDPS
jgi:hypothetical protein